MKLMLAGKAPEDLSQLRYPVLVSPKLDGVRAFVWEGTVWSRNNKPIRSQWVQNTFGKLEGLDGELVCGSPTAKDCFRNTSSEVMSTDGGENAVFFVFDTLLHPTKLYGVRYLQLSFRKPREETMLLPHTLVHGTKQLNAMEQSYVEAGYEGIMIRDPQGLYKYGRSTTKEGGLLKLKRFADGEAVVLAIEEEMHNANEKGLDGKRTSHQAGKVGKKRMGALRVRDKKTKQEFSVGTGFKEAERIELWKHPPIGRIITYKHFPVGVKDLPRFPTFVGFREDI